MGVKYHCPKCGKRFVDWGAKKLEFKCPDCEDGQLVRFGGPESKPPKRPSLKRAASRAKPKKEELPAARVAFDELPEELGEEIEEEVDEEPEEPLEEIVHIDTKHEETEVGLEFDEEAVAETHEEAAPEEDIEEGETLGIPEDLSFGEVTPPLTDETFEEENDW